MHFSNVFKLSNFDTKTKYILTESTCIENLLHLADAVVYFSARRSYDYKYLNEKPLHLVDPVNFSLLYKYKKKAMIVGACTDNPLHLATALKISLFNTQISYDCKHLY